MEIVRPVQAGVVAAAVIRETALAAAVAWAAERSI